VANLTLAIDDALLLEARIKALQQGTSVNEVCRRAIEHLVRGDEQGHRQAELRASVQRALPRARGATTAWQGREAVYDERLGLSDTGTSGTAPRARR
jgi:hypothetical protein